MFPQSRKPTTLFCRLKEAAMEDGPAQREKGQPGEPEALEPRPIADEELRLLSAYTGAALPGG